MSMQFSPFPNLETERTILRRLEKRDASDVFEIRSDPEVMRYIPRPLAVSIDDAVALIQLIDDFIDKSEKINWAIEWKASGHIIGIIGYVNLKPEHFRAEIGYSLARAYQRQGIMREALLQVMKYGFEAMNLHTIEAIVDAENVASAKLLESVGFMREAYFREDFLFNGRYRNSIHFGMLRSEAMEREICTRLE